MESFEAAKVLYRRILESEPENITKKIIGYIYLQDHADQEMIRLAFGPDNLIQPVIHKAKIELGIIPKPIISPPISPSVRFNPFSQPSSRPFSSTPIRVLTPYWDHSIATDQQLVHGLDFPPVDYADTIPEDYHFQNQTQFSNLDTLEDQLEPLYPEFSKFSNDCSLSIRGRRHSLSLPEIPVKVCHYFSKGFCKHGSNCKFFHGERFSEAYTHFSNVNDFAKDDQIFLPGSLEKLEVEITEILRCRRGNPVSIASLPMIYYEKYGRTLQAEGYLTESQRHGKAGYSLTKLLARLQNSIRVIDRPHGQHSVILAEDAPKYIENRCDGTGPGPIVSGSRQIYLTFPAESTFTEEDISNYFSTFGAVQDVRIPWQDKRMFGFVTFASADTVKVILSKGNPHYVCGARVLVKPYREKSKLIERKYAENIGTSFSYSSHLGNIESEIQARWELSGLLGKKIIEERDEDLESERLCISQLYVTQNIPENQSYFTGYINGPRFSEDDSKFPSAERVSYLLHFLKSGSPNGSPKHSPSNYAGMDNSDIGLNLPERPFSPTIASGGISTAT